MRKLRRILFFILCPIFLGVLGEFMIKDSINGLQVSLSIDSLIPILTNTKVLLGLSYIIMSGALWIVAMSKFELSFLYPFLSINYLAIIFGSKLFLAEEISYSRYLSAIAISIGLIIISRSPNSATEGEN